MTVDINRGFDNGDSLLDIRTNLLNPLTVKTKSLEGRVGSTEAIAQKAFTLVHDPDIANKTLTFHSEGGEQIVSLDGMFREGSDLELEDRQGTIHRKIHKLDFPDTQIISSGGAAEVLFPWDTIVPEHQKHLSIGQAGGGVPVTKPTALYFKGGSVEVTSPLITTVTIPDPTPKLKAKIGTGEEQEVETINIIGNTDSTIFEGSTLKISIPTSGGGGISNQNFKGFFASLGDIISEVTDPISGKSYAFAKDSKLGGEYYTPYLYLNGAWTDLKQDPALTYSAPLDPLNHGVFSIKPDDRIKIDATGQLDLSGLAVDETRLNFHGFYDTQGELEAAIPRPILNKSLAYIRHPNGAWVGKVYRNLSTGPGWQVMAPIGALSLVASPGSSATPTPFYGIYSNEMVTVDANGIATINGKVEQTIEVITTDAAGDVVRNDVNSLQFMSGKSYVTLQGRKAFVNHPQRVIQYNSEFEGDHNSEDYEGNIFYDQTSRCWMGWGIPEAPGGVDAKWTRIAHPKMSDEVKDLNRRLPRKAPDVIPGILGDSTTWEYNGWSYMIKGDIQLPEEFRDRCGGYISTVIQDVENDTSRPQQRLQVCYADELGGHCYVRRWNKGTGSEGAADYGWFPWVKISMSAQDISDHNEDPSAHKDVNKYYKIGTIDWKYSELKTKGYNIFDKDLLLLADSHGLSKEGEQYSPIPYTGSFKFSGRIYLDDWGTAAGVNTQWILKVIRVRNNIDTVIGDFTFNHTTSTSSKYLPSLKWGTGGLPLVLGDKVYFKFQCLNDTTFNNYPQVYFAPMRTYFVIEDANTDTGSRIAEMHRRTTGSVSTRNNTGVNVHYTNYVSGAVRIYGSAIDGSYLPMTKVLG